MFWDINFVRSVLSSDARFYKVSTPVMIYCLVVVQFTVVNVNLTYLIVMIITMT